MIGRMKEILAMTFSVAQFDLRIQNMAKSLWTALFFGLFDNVPVCRTRSIAKCVSQFGVGELDCPAQSPDLTFTLDELEHSLCFISHYCQIQGRWSSR